jgi:hypothetical protein
MNLRASLLAGVVLLGPGCESSSQGPVPDGGDGGDASSTGDVRAADIREAAALVPRCFEFPGCDKLIYGPDGCPVGCDVSGWYDAAAPDRADASDAPDAGTNIRPEQAGQKKPAASFSSEVAGVGSNDVGCVDLPAFATTATAAGAAAAATPTHATTVTTAATPGPLARFADVDSASLKLTAVQILNCFLGPLFGGHFDKRETAWTARVTVHHQFHLGHFVAFGSEGLPQVGLVDRIREVPNVQSLSHVISLSAEMRA